MSQARSVPSLWRTLLVAGIRHRTGLRFHLIGRIAHGDAEARPLEHGNVVGLIPNGGDFGGGYAQGADDALYNIALVGIIVGNTEIVRLRTRRRGDLAESGLGIGFTFSHPIVVVAHADDLGHLARVVSKSTTTVG